MDREEQVRVQALQAASRIAATKSGWSTTDILLLAQIFEEYIKIGRIREEQRRW